MLFQIGPFQLDDDALELRLEGRSVDLPRLPIRLLVLLVRHRDRIVSRDEVFASLWPDRAVSDGILTSTLYSLRQALSASGEGRSWIHTIRGKGLRFEGPCTAVETGERLPRPAPFVARDEVLAKLLRATRAMRQGHGRLVVIPARAGMGKTRLIREALTRLDGDRVIEARAEPDSRDDPMGLWLEVLSGLGADTRGDFEAAPPARIHREVRRRLEAAVRDQPTLIVLEDLHWAHPASIGTLAMLQPRIAETNTLIVASYRPGDVSPTDQRLLQLALQPEVIRLELAPFEVADVYTVLTTIRERDTTQDEVARILRRSEGVPLYCVQLAFEDAATGERGESTILSEQVARLPKKIRLALGYAALFGIRFEIELVERAMDAASRPGPEWISDSLGAGVLVRDGERPGRCRFAHALYQEAALSLIGSHDRLEAHRRIADLLETTYVDPPPSIVRALARHTAASASDVDRLERAARWNLEVARAASKRFAWEEVLEWTEPVRDCLARIPATEARQTAAFETELMNGTALVALPKSLASLQDAIERAERFLADADADAEADVEDQSRLAALRALAAHQSGDLAGADAALAELRLSGERACHLADALTILVDVQSGRFDAAHARGLALARDPGPPTRSLLPTWEASDVCLAFSSVASLALGEEDVATMALEVAEARARQRGDAITHATILFTACVAHDLRQDWPLLERTAARIDPLCTEFDVRRFLGSGFSFEQFAKDHLTPTGLPFEIVAGVVQNRAKRVEGTSFRPYLSSFAARLFDRADRPDEVRACFEEAVSAVRAGEVGFGPEVLREHGRWLERVGETDAARTRLEEARTLATDLGAVAWADRARADLRRLDGS
ncbi:MAG: AAA family ATPase [Myxococcota bacterium]